jgi:hypothetical protein
VPHPFQTAEAFLPQLTGKHQVEREFITLLTNREGGNK